MTRGYKLFAGVTNLGTPSFRNDGDPDVYEEVGNQHDHDEYQEIDDVTACQTYEVLQKDSRNDTPVPTEYEVTNDFFMNHLPSSDIL